MGAASHVAGSTSDDHHAIRTFLRHFPVFIKSGPLPRPPRPHPLWDAKKSFPGNHSRDLQLTFFFLPTKWTTRERETWVQLRWKGRVKPLLLCSPAAEPLAPPRPLPASRVRGPIDRGRAALGVSQAHAPRSADRGPGWTGGADPSGPARPRVRWTWAQVPNERPGLRRGDLLSRHGLDGQSRRNTARNRPLRRGREQGHERDAPECHTRNSAHRERVLQMGDAGAGASISAAGRIGDRLGGAPGHQQRSASRRRLLSRKLQSAVHAALCI